MGCFSPDEKYIATASIFFKEQLYTARLWSTGEAARIAEFTEHTVLIACLAFSPNGELLAFGDRLGIVYIRRVSSGT